MAKNLQHFEVLRKHLEKARADFKLTRIEDAMPFVVLPMIVDIRADEVEDTITDNSFQSSRGRPAGHDRGTDAIVIQSGATESEVHIFNFKYVQSFENTDKNFPSGEIDKILTFLTAVFDKDRALLGDTNQVLTDKVREIWDEIGKQQTRFFLHFVSNVTSGIEPSEYRRLSASLKTWDIPDGLIETQASLATRFANANRVKIDGRFKGIEKDLFVLTTGNVRALILRADARDILRLLCGHKDLRNDPNSTDNAALSAANLDENAFDDNVRVYLKEKSKINVSIKNTALSSEASHFFYFNNGITMTCDRFAYPPQQRGPIITVENVQVVNGGQTLHALFEAFATDATKIEPIELLCRVYETADRTLSSRIAERTNSQSPVDTRDIHSNDEEQINLEREFKTHNLFYERKKAQFADRPIADRIDSEKCGQVYLAFYEDMPLEAKNRKGWIFGDKRTVIFNQNTTADTLLLPLRFFDNIEDLRHQNGHGQRAWLNYASYHILYALKLMAKKRRIPLVLANLARIQRLTTQATTLVRKARKAEKEIVEAKGEEFADVLFFKQKKAKEGILKQANS
jgi:hypothetical protein